MAAKTCARCQAKFSERGPFLTCPACRSSLPDVPAGCTHWTSLDEMRIAPVMQIVRPYRPKSKWN